MICDSFDKNFRWLIFVGHQLNFAGTQIPQKILKNNRSSLMGASLKA